MKMRASLQLRMMECQELQASRAARSRTELWMERQERAYCAWLNHLLRQPMQDVQQPISSRVSPPRQSCADELTARVHEKQPRRILGKPRLGSARASSGINENHVANLHTPADAHLQQICSGAELRSRLQPYLMEPHCNRIVSIMTQVAKHIDEGRLKMKTDCPILTDVALRQKALEVLLSYNPTWLRLGLVVVLGPLALLGDIEMPKICSKGAEEVISENALLEVLLEQQFLADAALAKQHARNRSIEGLYRDGYKEALGKLILKRILLLVLVLDKIKCETALNSGHGIDGLDGGSPLLFRVNTLVKSSRQALEVFLLDSMQGEGDLISHLGKSGYYVSHIQAPLCEYNFEVQNVVADLQDGIHLCRLAQLMSHDLSVLVELKCPCDLRKKRLHNCKVALESLACAGVPLQDELGACITADHIVDGQRDKILPLLWNIILYLQIPKLVSHPKLWKQIFEAEGPQGSFSMVNNTKLILKICFLKILIICANTQDVQEVDMKAVSVDKRSLQSEQNSEITGQHGQYECQGPPTREGMTLQARETTAHNFQLLERIVKKHGNLPQVLELTDLVEGDPCTSERNIIIFVAYLCCWLTCYRGYVQRRKYHLLKMRVVRLQALIRGKLVRWKFILVRGVVLRIQGYWCGHSARQMFLRKRLAATKIQCCYRAYVQRRRFLLDRRAVVRFQAVLRGILVRKRKLLHNLAVGKLQTAWQDCDPEVVATRIQCWYRCYAQRKLYCACRTGIIRLQAVVRGKLVRQQLKVLMKSVNTIQACWQGYCLRCSVLEWKDAATQIQSWWRGCGQRKGFHMQRDKVVMVQACVRGNQVRKRLQILRQAVTRIEAAWWAHCLKLNTLKQMHAAMQIQARYRAHVQRMAYCKSQKAIVQLQAIVRGVLVRRRMKLFKEAVSKIQSTWRGYCTRQTLLNWTVAATSIQSCHRGHVQRRITVELDAGRVLTIWAKTQHDRLSFLRLRKSAIVIQSHFRGVQARKYFAHVKKSARLIQAHWKGHEWRKRQGHVMKQMQQLRFRMQITASKVDNSQRLGHRLTNALAQLLSQKTVSGILHTCATIDVATEHSKQCCERLAEGGAILKLLQLIQTTNRSPPHEQVLKHALSILANLARFPDLALRIVNTSDSIMIIAEQLLVNKEEVFSKAMEVVQHVCSTPGCAEIIKRTSLVIRRLQNVAQMLERKHDVEKSYIDVDRRNLEKIPQSQPILRKAAERKVREIRSHHFNIISTLQHFSLGAHCMPAVYGAGKANFTQKDRRSSMIGAPSQLLAAPSQLRTPFQGHIAGNKSKVSIQAKVPRAALTDRSNY
ncbi:unnamed protein product [Sphagnum balticum]